MGLHFWFICVDIGNLWKYLPELKEKLYLCIFFSQTILCHFCIHILNEICFSTWSEMLTCPNQMIFLSIFVIVLVMADLRDFILLWGHWFIASQLCLIYNSPNDSDLYSYKGHIFILGSSLSYETTQSLGGRYLLLLTTFSNT